MNTSSKASISFVSFVVIVAVILNPSWAIVENYLKTSVSPCEDFYEYACGKWSIVNSDVELGDTLSLLDMAMNEKVAKFLETNHGNDVFGKMKTFYDSCRNLKNYKTEEFLTAVKPKGGWAIYENSWKSHDFDWLATIAEMRKYAVQVFLEQTVMPKWDNTSVNIIYLDVVKVHPSSKASFKDSLIKASVDKSKVDAIADELIAFEKKLVEITAASHQTLDNDDAEEVVLGYLGETLPQVNWVRYLSIVFGRELDLYTPMIVQNTEFMSKLVTFLNNSEPRQVCNYIMVKFLHFIEQHSIDDTSQNECTTVLHQSMPLAVGYIVENNFYDPDYDQVVQDLFNFLKVEFLAEVSKLYEKQRDVLLFIYTKASVMDLQIGNTKRKLSLEAVSKYYEGLRFDTQNFYANILAAFKLKSEKELQSLTGIPLDIAYQWTVTPSPFFVQPKNRIVVPLTLLQERILGRDSADKYSVLGFIIGHEFLHAFDVTGVNYDYEGAMVESAVSRNANFLQRVQCVEDQLAGKSVKEKIADLGGIRLAYNAYKRSLMQVGKNVTANEGSERPVGQAFFIDFAQFFCGVNKKEAKQHSGPDVHDADSLRVKQSLMNFEEFSTAFGCRLGSVMNPVKKCRVW